MTGEHCGHECVCGRFGITTFPYGSHCLANRDDDYDPCEYDTRGASHSSSPAAAPVVDELEARFATKMEAWEQGFKDGKTAALVDLNIIKQQAAAEAWEKVLKEFESIMKISGIDHWDFRKGYEQKRGPTIPDHFTIFYSSGGCGSCTELEYQILKLLESLRREGEQHG